MSPVQDYGKIKGIALFSNVIKESFLIRQRMKTYFPGQLDLHG